MPVTGVPQYQATTYTDMPTFEASIQTMYTLGWNLVSFTLLPTGSFYAVFSRQQLVAL